MYAFDVSVLGMPCHLMVNPYVTWRMGSVMTVPLTQLDVNVNYVSLASLVTPQEMQNVQVGQCEYFAMDYSWVECTGDVRYTKLSYHPFLSYNDHNIYSWSEITTVHQVKQ